MYNAERGVMTITEVSARCATLLTERKKDTDETNKTKRYRT
jgi:hypothetical protein